MPEYRFQFPIKGIIEVSAGEYPDGKTAWNERLKHFPDSGKARVTVYEMELDSEQMIEFVELPQDQRADTLDEKDR